MGKICDGLLPPPKSLIPTRDAFADEDTTGEQQQSQAPPYTKRNIVKNIFVLNFGAFLVLMTFLALSDLQSTINSLQGLGTASQAAIYASGMAACLLLPHPMIRSLGCKWTLVFGLSCSACYTASNYWPAWSTMIPAAVMQGLSTGVVTVAYSTYVHEMALRYGTLSRADDPEAIEALFFGMYSLMCSSTQIWGNVVSYFVLRPSATAHHSVASSGDHCGVDFGGPSDGTIPSAIVWDVPSERKCDLLFTIFLAINALSVLATALFLDPLQNDRERSEGSWWSSALDKLTAAVKHALRVDQCLLVPFSVYCGLEMGFYIGQFTQAFIACSWGVYHVGFVTIGYGVCGFISSILVGPLVKWTSHTSVIVLATLINITTCGLLFLWKPTPHNPIFYFVFAGLLGVTDAVWWSQILALHGIMFSSDRESAFSNFFFWANFGLFVNFFSASHLTISAMICILLTVLLVSIVLYIVLRVKIKSAPRTGYVPLH